jgi:KaiC/GvpD/RAD55 family RecA-like ATPase
LPHQWARIALLIITCSSLLAAVSPVVWAPAGPSYSLTISPGRLQESITNQAVLSLRVTNASAFTNYGFTWTVTDPSGSTHTANNSTNSGLGTSFTLSTDYPKNFVLGSLRYVGNYTVRVDETSPSAISNVASGHFQVGLTDSPAYRRTDTTSFHVIGYRAGENVSISMYYASNPVQGFPTWGSADPNGVVSYLWQSSPGALVGTYNITLQGSTTVKTPPDTQLFTLQVTNITIPQLMVARTSLNRTETQVFTFAPTYLSGVAVQSGVVQITLVEPDSITTHYTTASYTPTCNLNQGCFQANYRIPINSQAGAWASSIRASSFNDGYGNTGPLVGVTDGFNVQPAQLSVSVIVQNKTYASGDLMAIYAQVLGPDGSQFTSGTVIASLSTLNSGSPIGSRIPLFYIPSQSRWLGSTVINSTSPAGIWLVNVNASDTYRNSGQGSGVVVVNSALAQQPTTQPLNLFYFIIVAGIVASGLMGSLIFRRFSSTYAPFDKLYSITGGQFQPPTTLMIRGESGSGTTMLGLQLVYEGLQSGKSAVILTYDSFPTEIQRQMKGMGWDVQRFIENGSLQFIDCYSALVGGETTIKDPIDFTEVSIQVSNKVGGAKPPVTVLLDSFTPIFNSAQVRHAINFLRVLGAKVKNDGGFFMMTGTRGSLPEAVESNLESVVDGVIDLHLVRKGDRLVRLLTVKKVGGHQIGLAEKEYRIVEGKGILFRTPRVDLRFLERR